ncbi:GNAT family N-acetyltransferase [Thaumasiovibrio subtropicus]|uniref:GNAT family N-acetyltransferase n=1 Tax=Thaumasiovibrio subtropicus TaxID=1891207 RepID=UPI000B35A3C1|nr:GNAT family N-acetyltransferase [Thaumasiovibrio subtropicus]
MEFIIRNALGSDGFGINEVSKHLGYAELSSSSASSKLEELLNTTLDQVYVAEIDGHIIGWLHLSYARRLASDNYFEICGLVVSPDFRGRGVGKHLVQFAQDKNDGKMRVRCNELRVESHKFYEAVGFHSNKLQRVFQHIHRK